MISTTVIDSLNTIAQNIKQATDYHWWNTQWAAALIGAAAAITFTALGQYWNERKKELMKFYLWLMEQGTFSSPDALLDVAGHTSYTAASNGDKPIGEKMVIEFRKHTKYWYLPLSRIRLMLQKYEKFIGKIKNPENNKNYYNDIKNQIEYLKAEKLFKKIMAKLEKITGENQFTI